MELLQKLTFYDLLGYTLPGTVLLELLQWNIQGGRLRLCYSTSHWVFLIAFGYLTGIIISELAERAIRRGKRICRKLFDMPVLIERTCDECGITLEQLAHKLKSNDMLTKDVTEFKELNSYMGWIYALVQCDPQSRIHNYSTAALLYKNMVPVSLTALVCGFWIRSIPEVIAASLGVIAFSMRYSKFSRKKNGYALYWFMSDKYQKTSEKNSSSANSDS